MALRTRLLFWRAGSITVFLQVANMLQHGAAYTPFILEGGQYYRLFTSMFLHFGIQHLANNMLVLFVLGQRMERVFGGWKFLVLYLVGGIGGNLVSLYLDTVTQEYAVSAGSVWKGCLAVGNSLSFILWEE